MSGLKERIIAAAAPDLAAIETALRENLGAHLEIVEETASHILFAGGKRLRPLLMRLSARICGYKGDEDVRLSTVFEYLHAATLLHDDLVDGAHLRRNKPAAHAVYGNSIAVLVGDFLLARSLSIATRPGKLSIMEVIAGITEEMSQGEIHQLIKKGDILLSEADYMEVIRRKTAVLIRGACRVGALLADAPEARADALTRYGYHLGVAFQMADDLLDYTADTTELGKEVGADIREGKLTLPLIHALQRADTRQRDRIEGIVRDQTFSEDDFRELIDLLETLGGIRYTRRQAEAHVAEAKAALTPFGPSRTRETLLAIAEYALHRKV
jgi:octaprenyl-diphosphate synthase